MKFLTGLGRVAVFLGKTTVKLPFTLFRGLFGRDFLGRDLTQQTKTNIANLKNTFAQFKNRGQLENADKYHVNEDEAVFEKVFLNIRLTSLAVIAMFLCTAIKFFQATQLHDFFVQLSFAALLGMFYLALNRYSYKIRLVYQHLPGQLSDEDQIITWGKYFSAVADQPSLIMPSKLSK